MFCIMGSFLSETGATCATDVYETIKSSKDSQEGTRSFKTKQRFV